MKILKSMLMLVACVAMMISCGEKKAAAYDAEKAAPVIEKLEAWDFDLSNDELQICLDEAGNICTYLENKYGAEALKSHLNGTLATDPAVTEFLGEDAPLLKTMNQMSNILYNNEKLTPEQQAAYEKLTERYHAIGL